MANAALTAEAAGQATATDTVPAAGQATTVPLVMSLEGDTALPDQVGYVPIAKPGNTTPAEAAPAGAEQPQQPSAAAVAEQAKADTRGDPGSASKDGQARSRIRAST